MVYQNSPNNKLALDVMICILDRIGCVSMKMLLSPLVDLNANNLNYFLIMFVLN